MYPFFYVATFKEDTSVGVSAMSLREAVTTARMYADKYGLTLANVNRTSDPR